MKFTREPVKESCTVIKYSPGTNLVIDAIKFPSVLNFISKNYSKVIPVALTNSLFHL